MIKGLDLIFNQFSGMVIALSIAFIVILYLLSRVFKDLRNFFEVEFSEFWVNIALYLSMGGLVILSQYIVDYVMDYSASLAGFSSTPDVFTFLQLQLSILQSNVGKEMAYLMMVGQAAKIYDRSEYMVGYPGAKTVKGKIYPGIGIFVNSIFFINGLLLAVMGSLTVQQIMLDIIKYLAFAFFLPVGILLRFFPGVRSFGSELIALSLSLGVVLPLTYFLFYVAMYDVGMMRGGYYEDFVKENSGALSPLLNPAKTLNETTVPTNYESWVDSFYNSLVEKIDGGWEWFKSASLTILYPFFYVANLPVAAILLYYHLIKVGGFLVYAVAIPSFAITFAMVSTRAIKDFIHNL